MELPGDPSGDSFAAFLPSVVPCPFGHYHAGRRRSPSSLASSCSSVHPYDVAFQAQALHQEVLAAFQALRAAFRQAVVKALEAPNLEHQAPAVHPVRVLACREACQETRQTAYRPAA